MQQHSNNIHSPGNDPEATLVAPRFDAEEERRAHPVVPLAEAGARAPFPGARTHARRGLPRSWPTALVAVVLLAVVAVGGVVATKVLRSPQASGAAQAEAAPAPQQAFEVQQQQTPLTPQAPREEASAKRTARTHGRARAAEAGTIPAPAEGLVYYDDDKREKSADKDDDKDDERRGRGREREKRRGRDDDDERREARAFEKEMRKALKQEKGGKAARLVDVIIGP